MSRDVQTYFKQGLPKPKGRRRPLKPVSEKRRATNVIRKANCFEAFGPMPPCYACLPLQLVGIDRARTGCRGFADDAHELLSRARGGSITDPSNIAPVSRDCHRFITEHPELAEAAGLALPSPRVVR